MKDPLNDGLLQISKPVDEHFRQSNREQHCNANTSGRECLRKQQQVHPSTLIYCALINY